MTYVMEGWMGWWVGGSDRNKAQRQCDVNEMKWRESESEREITQVQVDDVCIVLAVQVCPAEVSHLSALTQPAA